MSVPIYRNRRGDCEQRDPKVLRVEADFKERVPYLRILPDEAYRGRDRVLEAVAGLYLPTPHIAGRRRIS
jgi:hypothetical protein